MNAKLLIKSFTVLLLIAIAFNSLFYYVFYHLSVIYTRSQSHEWLARADKASLTLIKVPAGDFDTDDPDDVWYNGKLYDVADWKAVKDTVYAYVLADVQEQELVSKMESHTISSGDYAPAPDGKAAAIKSVNRFSAITFFFEPPGVQVYARYYTTGNFQPGAEGPVSPANEVLTPPPRRSHYTI